MEKIKPLAIMPRMARTPAEWPTSCGTSGQAVANAATSPILSLHETCGVLLPEVLEADFRGTAPAGVLPFLELAQEWPR